MQSAAQNVSFEVRPKSMDWLISFKDPRVLWEEHWMAVTLEFGCAGLCLLVYRHAKRVGARSVFLFLAAMFSTFCLELFPLIPRPGYQLWWYHQGTVNFIFQRVPSFVMTLFAFVHYLAHCATIKTNLPNLTRSLVTALSAMMIFFPCLLLAGPFLLQLLHFDDPVFQDRLLNIPIIQLITVALLFFHTSHEFQNNFNKIEEEEHNLFNHVCCSMQTGLVSAIYSIVEQYLLYMMFRLILKNPTVVCPLIALLILVILAKKELQQLQIVSYSWTAYSPLKRKDFWVIFATLAFISALPVLINPVNLKSNGARLELGPCDVIQEVSNTSPLEIPRHRYVCVNDTKRLDFDFHCVSEVELSRKVPNTPSHYTVCGKPFQQPVQMAKMFALYYAFGLLLLYNVMSFKLTFKKESVKLQDPCKKVE